jgi:hypothetical protein
MQAFFKLVLKIMSHLDLTLKTLCARNLYRVTGRGIDEIKAFSSRKIKR